MNNSKLLFIRGMEIKCRIYKDTLCIMKNEAKNDDNCYCCSDCLIHLAIKHDKMLEQETNE